MKTNPTSTVTTRLQALGLVAAILSPGMVLAKPASSLLVDGPKSEMAKSRSAQKAAAFNRAMPPTVRFNTIDGDPIK